MVDGLLGIGKAKLVTRLDGLLDGFGNFGIQVDLKVGLFPDEAMVQLTGYALHVLDIFKFMTIKGFYLDKEELKRLV